MFFSIIIPLYNKGALVKRAIDSVLLQQTTTNFEVVVVDDGSTDDSAQFVKAYKDRRVRYFFKKNGGVSSARNFGAEKAEGEWLLFLDADDELFPNSLLGFSKSVARYPNVDFHVAKQNNHYEGHGLIQRFLYKNRTSSIKITVPYFAHWLRLCFPRPGTVVLKKEMMETLGYFDVRLSFYEDIDFYLKQMKVGTIAFLPMNVLVYHQDGTGLSCTNHPIEKEMAYYISDIIKQQQPSFWHKALLYENLEMEIFWWQQKGNMENVAYYKDMQARYFGKVYAFLHWIRQKMIRLEWI